MAVCELDIGDDLTGNSELFERRLGVSAGREEEDVPVVVPHGGAVGRGGGCLIME